MTGQRIGYVRVSTVDQNEQRQLDGEILDRTFTDKASGRDANRPALAELLRVTRDGDTVVVHSTDRLARDLDDLRSIVRALNHRGVLIEFVTERLVFTGDDSALANLMLSVKGAFAKFERRSPKKGARVSTWLSNAARIVDGQGPSAQRVLRT